MSKLTSPPQEPEAPEIPESRLAQKIAHDILCVLGTMIQSHHLLNVAFQDETTDFSLAVDRLKRESYNPAATLEAVEELYKVLQRLLGAYKRAYKDQPFQIPPVLQDDFATRSGFAQDQVLAEMMEEEIHETAKKVISGKKEGVITNVKLHIRARVVQEIRAIIDFAMQDCVLETADGTQKVTEILNGTTNAAILALLIFNDDLLRLTKKEYPETRKNGQLATIILAVRERIRKGKIPTPKKRRGPKISYHPSDARLEGCDIGTVRAVERRAIQGLRERRLGTSAESTDVPANLQSFPDET